MAGPPLSPQDRGEDGCPPKIGGGQGLAPALPPVTETGLTIRRGRLTYDLNAYAGQGTRTYLPSGTSSETLLTKTRPLVSIPIT